MSVAVDALLLVVIVHVLRHYTTPGILKTVVQLTVLAQTNETLSTRKVMVVVKSGAGSARECERS